RGGEAPALRPRRPRVPRGAPARPGQPRSAGRGHRRPAPQGEEEHEGPRQGLVLQGAHGQHLRPGPGVHD
ncbi:unnamed protein product, partial [Heterosigma akashiwo]